MTVYGFAPHRVVPGTAVVTPSGGSGIITFARDGICTIGSGFEASSLITRYGGNSLFLLRGGVTSCTLARNTSAAPHYACAKPCSLVVEADGTSFRTHSSNPIVIDGFQGQVRVKATDSSGVTSCGASAKGGTSNFHVVIHITTIKKPNSITTNVTITCRSSINVGFTKTEVTTFQEQRQQLGLG